MHHGGFRSATQAARTYGWSGQAERAAFVVAYPDGAWPAWNTEGGCCGRSARRGVDDVGFLEAVVLAVMRSVRVDPRRVYVTGMSNGGVMCDLSPAATQNLSEGVGSTRGAE